VSEGERRQRTISSTPRLTPDEVAGRTFATAFRGLAEGDVRSFLKRVSEELATARSREQELLNTIDELEARLRTPQPLDEHALLDALGEETTRLLRSAREVAIDIRGKAEERASKLVHDAQEESQRLRQEAEDVLGVRTHDAESVAQGVLEEAEQRASDLMRVADERAAEVRATADHYTEELRARVEHESTIELESARERGRATLEEAASLRERIIDDLARRRELLTGQLEELRAGRDRLLDAYRIVKRTFLEATEALAQVEARATAARSAGGADPADLGAAVAAESEAARIAGLEPEVVEAAPTPEAEPTGTEPTGTEPTGTEPSGAEPAPPDGAESGEPDAEPSAPNFAAVDDLFARLRAGAQGETGADEVGVVIDVTTGATSDSGQAENHAGIDIVRADDDASADDPAWLSQRDESLAPLRVALVRQVKLAIGNEQNDVLDKVRRHKGRTNAASVLPEADAQVAAWAAVVLSAVSEAYDLARRREAGDMEIGDAVAVPDDLAPGIARTMVEPLRDRLVAAIDGGHEPGETASQVAERIGARCREWKNRSAESSVEDALVGAYARGSYDSAADDAVLIWRAPPGGCCPDCADNALEPTRKGETFPTGHQYPPAHPGCRCTVVSVVSDARPSGSVQAESTSSS
jgi:DivIVA domain-containing protein